jgi:excisionase family DNA binding protein
MMTVPEQYRPDWLTPRQAADVIGASVRSVYRAISRQELRAKSINDRGDYRISRRWLEDWLNGQSVDRRAS